MAITRVPGGFETAPLSDVQLRALSRIPTHFGRLVYLAGLRSWEGVYEHHALSAVLGRTLTHRALSDAHLKLFREWINKTVAEQKSDLDAYLASLSAEKHTVIDTWVRLRPYRNLVPTGAPAVERNLFCVDFEALLGLLMNVFGVAYPDRDE